MSLYLALLETPALCMLGVDKNFVWGEDLLESPLKCQANTVFNVELKMNDDGAFYSTDPASFEVNPYLINPT